jgi:Ohr subfamily peroxiredoxin
MKHVALQQKVALPEDAAIDTEVDLCKGEDGYSIQARLNVSLPGMEHEAAERLVEAAHEVCPYSKATRGNIETVISVV